ncbi:MAG: hypothetical protein RSF88_09235 [Lachnospiraceae bacterium]
MKKWKVSGIVMVCGVLLFSTVCSAASWKSYSTTVGRLNGSGYTGSQTVSNSASHSAWLDSFTVGGDYVVDARVQGYSGGAYKAGGPWERDITDDKMYFLYSNSEVNFTQGRVNFSNDVTTPVNVQVTGEFTLNE